MVAYGRLGKVWLCMVGRRGAWLGTAGKVWQGKVGWDRHGMASHGRLGKPERS